MAASADMARLGSLAELQHAYERASALAGTRFAGYLLQDVIYNGRMSMIFRAREEGSTKPIAVKVLKPLGKLTVTDKSRFIRGAKHSAALRHPNFVRVLRGGRFKEWFFIAMEYVAGKNLDEVVEAKGGPLPPRVAIVVTRQILDALQHAYEHKLVYRALCPNNVIVCEGARIKLVDYDLLKPLGGEPDAQVTSIIASNLDVDRCFAAPELIAYPAKADQKADVFGAAALLYYMLCGRPPFDPSLPGFKPTSAFDRHFDMPRTLNANVHEYVEDVIVQAMSEYSRYDTPQEMREALDDAWVRAHG
jgi:serine/threonine-protein kinase